MKDSAVEFLARHADPSTTPLIADGTVIDGWRVTSFIGHGGSGEVYRVEEERRDGATTTRPPRSAALKVLVRDTDTARARFLREADLLARLDSPAFPQFIAKGRIGDRPYIVMELLEPCAMPSSDAATADFLLQICDGVAALHRLGYVHRDIKPGNILWRCSGKCVPVLIDLGLVKDVTRDHDASGTSLSLVDGHVVGVGTPGYSAPEQFAGDAVSPAADVHALGMLANACFCGKPPRAWTRIIDRATASIPSRRYPDVAAFARAIRRRHWRRNAVAACTLLFAALALALAGRVVRNAPPPQSAHAVTMPHSAWDIPAGFSPPLARTLPLDTNVGMDFVAIPSGTFAMSNAGGKGTHKVTLTHPYWITATYVTARQLAVLQPPGKNRPLMENYASLFPDMDVAEFHHFATDYTAVCATLNDRFAESLPPGYEFRLPTEAELEYAIRQGDGTGRVIAVESLTAKLLDERGIKGRDGVRLIPRGETNGWGVVAGFIEAMHVADGLEIDAAGRTRLRNGMTRNSDFVNAVAAYADGEVDPVRRGPYWIVRNMTDFRIIAPRHWGLARIVIAPKELNEF